MSMKKILIIISLFLISGCSNIGGTKVDYVPIEKINIELDLFVKGYGKDIYLIQQKHDYLREYSYYIEIIRYPDSSRGMMLRPLSDFEIIDFTRDPKEPIRNFITFVYAPLLDEYYVVDIRRSKVIDEKGNMVDSKEFFYEKAFPILSKNP